VKLSQEQTQLLNRVVVVPLTTKVGSNTEGPVHDMLQFILKEGEIKGIKGIIEKLKHEMQEKDARMTQFQKENEVLQERIYKLKMRIRGKCLLKGD
jgi:predicted RNase H-like nuclease (RuvC/YqgF family)